MLAAAFIKQTEIWDNLKKNNWVIKNLSTVKIIEKKNLEYQKNFRITAWIEHDKDIYKDNNKELKQDKSIEKENCNQDHKKTSCDQSCSQEFSKYLEKTAENWNLETKVKVKYLKITQRKKDNPDWVYPKT